LWTQNHQTMKAAQTMTTVREDPTAMAIMTFVAENEI
jgi:hypothetical protein